MEMMCHFEGPIVESFYDMALLSWHNTLTPQLPLVTSPPPPITTFTFSDGHVTVGETSEHEKQPDPIHPDEQGKAPIPQVLTSTENQTNAAQAHSEELPHTDKLASKGPSIVYDVNFTKEAERVHETLNTIQEVTKHLSKSPAIQGSLA